MTALCLGLAKVMGIEDEQELEYIRGGSLLHDVGKIAISAQILQKKENLSESEWVEIRKHPDKAGISAQIAIAQADIGEFEEALRFLNIAASVEPRNAQHIFNKAIIVDRMGDRARAVTLYQEALELDTIYGRGRTIPRESIYDRLAALRR